MKGLQCALWKKKIVTQSDVDRSKFEVVSVLADSSHLDRYLLKCKECGQYYFFEFYEEIDWENGNDPQYSTWIPIATVDEAEKMGKMAPIELLQLIPRLQKDFSSDAKKPSFRWIRK